MLTLDYFTHVGIMSVNVSSNLQIATTVLLTLIPTWNVLSGFYVPRPVSFDDVTGISFDDVTGMRLTGLSHWLTIMLRLR